MRCRTGLLVALALACAPVPASASEATLEVVDGDRTLVVRGDLTRNDITIANRGTKWVITDAARTIRGKGFGCSGVGEATCSIDGLRLLATLGGGDDRLRITTINLRDGVRVFGEGGDDDLAGVDSFGTDRNETLNGGPGRDVLSGHRGLDTLIGGTGPDTMSGGDGLDTVSYEGHTTGVHVTLDGVRNDGSASDEVVGSDARDLVGADVERLIGGAGPDVLIGDDGPNELNGVGGDDVLDGRGGQDFLIGSFGGDHLIGGLDRDTASYRDHADAVDVSVGDDLPNDGNAQVDGPAGSRDTVDDSIENLEGGQGGDRLVSTQGVAGPGFDNSFVVANEFFGRNGNDVVDGGPGPDRLHGNFGRDTVSYAGRTAGVTVAVDGGGAGQGGQAGEGDMLFLLEDAVGGRGDDTLIGDPGPNALDGGPGSDVLRGGDGDDTLRTDEDTPPGAPRGTASGQVDAEIDCGGGLQDTARLDLADQAASVTTGCEVVSAAPVGEHPIVAIGRAALRGRRGSERLRVPLRCPARSPETCRGRLDAAFAASPGEALATAAYALRRGARRAAVLRLSRREARAIRRGRALRLRAQERDPFRREKVTTRVLRRTPARRSG